VFAAVLGVSALTSAGHAAAKPQFPSVIASDLKLSYLPPCSLCHAKGNTSSATVTTHFGLALLARGLSGSETSLTSALASLAADGGDSDGDRVSDVAELKAGTDPNSPANASLVNNDDPGYGCGGSPPEPRSRQASAPLLLGGALAWVLKFRRARS
jgi:hypothetical protein